MGVSVTVFEPGSIRSIHYYAERDSEGKYPVVLWGTLEEQIEEATATNLKAHSGSFHKPMDLWTMATDCGHSNPEGLDKYEGVEDLLDDWVKRNLLGLDYRDGDLYWKNRRRGEAVIPLYAEWSKAQGEWDAVHGSGVCHDQYQGTCCVECAEGDEDSGYETSPCWRQEHAREAMDEFWYQVSSDGVADRQREDN
jgi:hypothetical protein